MSRTGESAMVCRFCGGEMSCEPRLDVNYYECTDCGGIWFNAGELETLFRKRVRLALPAIPDEDVPRPDHEPTNECPHCGDGVHLIPKTTYAARNVQVPVCFGHYLSRSQTREIVDRVCSGFLRRAILRLLKR